MPSKALKTNLDLIKECDNFLYPDDGEAYTRQVAPYYLFCVLETWSSKCRGLKCVGYMLPETVEAMPWISNFSVNHSARTITILFSSTASETEALSQLLTKARQADAFRVLRGWRNELYPILGLDRSITMERAGSALFGIHTAGVHMTAYHYTTTTTSTTSDSSSNLRIWVPQRASTKQTYGGMLDNSVAGGLAAGEDPLDCIVREAGEEASLPADLVRQRIRPIGTVSYIHVRDERAGGETGLLQPETQYGFDLELPADVVPRPSDDEVQEFYLWGVEEVRKALAEGQFKPNCALYLVDFLVRHGLVTAREEPDYLEIMTRMHRRIVFEDPKTFARKVSGGTLSHSS